MFFSWSRNRSFGKGPKKRELTDFNYSQSPPSFSLYKKVNFCRLVRTERLVFLVFFPLLQIFPLSTVAVSPRGRCPQEPVWSWGHRGQGNLRWVYQQGLPGTFVSA